MPIERLASEWIASNNVDLPLLFRPQITLILPRLRRSQVLSPFRCFSRRWLYIALSPHYPKLSASPFGLGRHHDPSAARAVAARQPTPQLLDLVGRRTQVEH